MGLNSKIFFKIGLLLSIVCASFIYTMELQENFEWNPPILVLTAPGEVCGCFPRHSTDHNEDINKDAIYHADTVSAANIATCEDKK